ncbi:hypothetical protein DFJ43DRAFT_1221876 [Lentinula guzmanii]|uniref:Urease accessory protein UreF n=1 Tax=Lentinula guzmanii TaxID=2804957 RepID=A0AA38N3P7_9AGAR|nr:hypothetical protein DFJ43DRAFT_1221876 [Lentinula guzmanii]
MDDETFLLLLLSDSNLPTGSFVASSGFESYIKHGFGGDQNNRTIMFMRDSISAYARSALAFVSDTYRIVQDVHRDFEQGSGQKSDFDKCLQKIKEVDDLYDTMTLNDVTKRASKSQGVALLTLYSKGLTPPLAFTGVKNRKETEIKVNSYMASLVAQYKSLVRAESAPGHLPICWGILTGALGLTSERSQYLHIFLHARSLLSASVRLNEIGPYNAQQTLLHISRSVIEAEVVRCKDLRTGIPSSTGTESDQPDGVDDKSQGPANTWPLGEILAARHDLQHSRIFNS